MANVRLGKAREDGIDEFVRRNSAVAWAEGQAYRGVREGAAELANGVREVSLLPACGAPLLQPPEDALTVREGPSRAGDGEVQYA